MLYCVRMDVNVPFGFDNAELEELKAKEKARAEVLQRTGKWRHLWRVAGRYANISVFDRSAFMTGAGLVINGESTAQ